MTRKTETAAREVERYGLTGYPVGHSLSPHIFSAAFAATGKKASYELFPIPPENLEDGIGKLVAMGVRGFNVTVPHKTSVIPLLARLEESAQLTGAVNTVNVTDDGLVGHNTDMGGFIDSLGPLGVGALEGKQALVVGAGGAARAVVTGLALAGVIRVTVSNRFREETEGLMAAVATNFPGLEIVPVGFGEKEVARGAAGAALCVHATSLGLSRDDPLPFDPSCLPEGCFLYDLVYGPRETALIRAARSARYRAADGKEMLLRQAALGYRIWTGSEPPMEAMRKGMEEGIRRG